ncbi:MAG: ABC transporter ATPase [Bacteroidota bacterium]
MIIPINNMPPHSRVLIYQANREFGKIETDQILSMTNEYITHWKSHEMNVNAACEIRYNRFIVVYIDESADMIGGCSLDKSIHFFQSLEQEFGVSLFDRMNIAYKLNGIVNSCNKSAFEKLVSEGIIDEDTLVFNNLVANKKELETNWEIPFKNSWHNKIFTLPQRV